MTEEDASLEDFFGGNESGDDAGETAVSDSAEGADTGSESTPDSLDSREQEPASSQPAGLVDPSGSAPEIDPAVATYRWTGTGARCDGCDAHIKRLWQEDDTFVCSGCKEW